MCALPLPDPNGDLAELRRSVNVTSEADWRPLVAWLLFAWCRSGQLFGDRGQRSDAPNRGRHDAVSDTIQTMVLSRSNRTAVLAVEPGETT